MLLDLILLKDISSPTIFHLNRNKFPFQLKLVCVGFLSLATEKVLMNTESKEDDTSSVTRESQWSMGSLMGLSPGQILLPTLLYFNALIQRLK